MNRRTQSKPHPDDPVKMRAMVNSKVRRSSSDAAVRQPGGGSPPALTVGGLLGPVSHP